MNTAEFATLLETTAHKRAVRAQAAEQLAALAGDSGAVSFSRVGRDARLWTALAGQDMSTPGQFRLTRFDADGPVGHTCYTSIQEVIHDALREGFEPDPIALPAAPVTSGLAPA
jgi:hypothetical protein